MLVDIRTFGAEPDDRTDNRAAIQAAIDHAVASGAAGILVPAGTYRVSRAPSPARWSLDLFQVDGFVVAGEGPSAVIRLADTTEATGDWHVLAVRDSRRVVVRDLVIDGNRTGLTDPDEQSHGIAVEPGTTDLTVQGCVLRDCFGDGVRLLGGAGEPRHVRRVRIADCLFQSNKRSGLGIQRALTELLVTGCYFDSTGSDQSIDFEPSGADGPADVVISGCVIRHTNRAAAVTLSGISGPDPSVRVKLVDNIILGGQVFSTDVRQLTVHGNIIVVPETEPPGNRVPVHVQRGGDLVSIVGNLLVTESPASESAVILSEVNGRPVRGAMVSSNICLVRGGSGIQIVSSDDVTVADNLVVATGACGQGVLVRTETSPADRVSVRDNDITAADGGSWAGGIRLVGRDQHPISELAVVGNTVSGAAEGIRFAGQGFADTPICALNRVGPGVDPPVAGIGALPEAAVVVGGATAGTGAQGTGSGRWLTGIGDPEGRVASRVGDVLLRLDGGPGSTFYVKESDDQPADGWVAK